MQFFFSYLYHRRKVLLLLFFFLFLFAVSFWLYRLPVEAVAYPALICAAIGLAVLILGSLRASRKHRLLVRLADSLTELPRSLPEPRTQDDEDYQLLVGALCEEQRRLKSTMELRYADMIDYYTVWAHQIKTPIASMRLTLQEEDSEFSRRAGEDLLRIEQYVEMVLCYLRLDSDSTDYVFREQELDPILRQAVRRLSGQFIRRRMHLQYEPLGVRVLTDEKWLLFVVEQVLTNALKYTPAGGTITIELEEPKTLCIRDTGIGIAPEDLPRIFEKGYTGVNGRADKKASGLGLYLCRRICRALGHTIRANSSPDSGTVIRIDLSSHEQHPE
ncbi:MAG: sensor histidine kinase [Clostridiales bacterium]|nr:sensor histidine kinase [Clostridiales bacterium]